MIEIAGTTNELVRTRDDVAEAPQKDGGALQRSCVGVLRAEWSVLALVAAGPGVPSRAVASALVETARSYRLRPVRILNGAGVPAQQLAPLLDELAAARGGEARTVVTLDDPRTDPSSAPLLVAADAALLLVRLGAAELRSVEEAVALVGRERVVGCVVVK
jgi:hypothetical protein